MCRSTAPPQVSAVQMVCGRCNLKRLRSISCCVRVLSHPGHLSLFQFRTSVIAFRMRGKTSFKITRTSPVDILIPVAVGFFLSLFFRPPIDYRPQPEVPEDQGLRRSYDGRRCHQHLVSVCWRTRPVASAVLCSGRYRMLQYNALERLSLTTKAFIGFITAQVMSASVLCQRPPFGLHCRHRLHGGAGSHGELRLLHPPLHLR